MARTACSIQPSLKRAVDRDREAKSVFDWRQRQRQADRKPTPPRGVTQAAPKKKATPVAPGVARNQITGKD